MKKKCTCGCHTNPSIIHVQACCKNGYVTVGPVLQSEFRLFDSEVKDSRIPLEDRIEHYKRRYAEEVAMEIVKVMEWEERRIQDDRGTEYTSMVNVYNFEEIRDVLVKLKRLRETVGTVGHYEDSIAGINEIINLLNP